MVMFNVCHFLPFVRIKLSFAQLLYNFDVFFCLCTFTLLSFDVAVKSYNINAGIAGSNLVNKPSVSAKPSVPGSEEP